MTTRKELELCVSSTNKILQEHTNKLETIVSLRKELAEAKRKKWYQFRKID